MSALRPLVSVVTPTWQRHDLLIERCIPAVRAQTYPNVEHVVVSDGPDPDLAAKLAALPGHRVALRFAQLGRNWTSRLTDSFAMAPSIVGDFLASGEYLTNCADDDEMAPDHLETLTSAIESEGAHFAFGQVRMALPDGRSYVIPMPGVTGPVFGQITSVLYKASLVDRSHWRLHDGFSADYALFKRWIDAGARCAFAPKLTFTHHVNH